MVKHRGFAVEQVGLDVQSLGPRPCRPAGAKALLVQGALLPLLDGGGSAEMKLLALPARLSRLQSQQMLDVQMLLSTTRATLGFLEFMSRSPPALSCKRRVCVWGRGWERGLSGAA